jgi:ATP-binding cassette subfamily C protein
MFKTFYSQFSLLRSREKGVYAFYLVAGSLLSVLDLTGVALSGIIGIYLSSKSFNSDNNLIANKITNLFQISTENEYSVIVSLTFLVLIFFVTKSLLSLWITKRLFKFLTELEKRAIDQLARNIFTGRYEDVSRFGKQDIADTLNRGLSANFTNLLGQWQIIISEVSLVALLLCGLIIINPIFSLVVFGYFLGVAFLVNHFLSPRVEKANYELTELRIESSALIVNSLDLYREYRVYNRVTFLVNKISKLINAYSSKYASDMWMQMMPKYIMEISMLVGIFLMLLIGQMSDLGSDLYLILITYFVASARFLPSVLRIQSATYTLKGHHHLAEKFIYLKKTFKNSQDNQSAIVENPSSKSQVKSSEEFIQFCDVSYSFHGEKELSFLHNVDLFIPMRKKVAIVGPSGAGKSTLADLIMGIIQPTTGEILVSAMKLSEWLESNQSAISYLPQESILVEGGLSDNIAFGVSHDSVDSDLLNKLLHDLNLNHLISRGNQKLESIKESMNLSGGEAQRIGIARALYNRPKLLVMDESTSSLDADSEEVVLKALNNIPEDVTVIMIAHRLSSIRHFDFLIYMESGRIVATGNFEELRSKSAQFDQQARLLGL